MPASLGQTFNYDDAGNLDYDTNLIETVGSVTQLKLRYEDVADFSEDFADDTDHVYDSAKAEFVGGLVRQKDQRPTDSVIGATYTSSKNASWPDGFTALENGTPTLSGGKLVCTGTQGLAYTGAAIAAVVTAGAVKIKYTPNFSGAPPVNVNVFGLIQSGGGNNNRILLTHSPSGSPGNFRLWLNNSSGTAIYTATTIGGNFNPVAGTEYELELNWDSVAGVVRLFVGGALWGTLTPGAWTRTGTCDRFFIGANAITYNRAEASFDDAVLFSTVQHTTAYAAGYTLPETLYDETAVTLPVLASPGVGTVLPRTTPTATLTGAPRFTIQGKYWDGADWADTDNTYAQATDLTTIATNFGSFPDEGYATIAVRAVFPTGNTQGSVDQFDMELEAEFYDQGNPRLVTNATTLADAIETFAAVAAAAGSDAVRFLFACANGIGMPETFMYHDGANWVVSDETYAQTNTATEMNTNLPTLDISTGKLVRFYIYLHSDDGTTTPSITSITFQYSFYAAKSAASKCILHGWVTDHEDLPIEGATVQIDNLLPFFHSGKEFPRFRKEVVTDADGYWEIALVETETVSHYYQYQVVYNELSDISKLQPRLFVLPDVASVAYALTDTYDPLAA